MPSPWQCCRSPRPTTKPESHIGLPYGHDQHGFRRAREESISDTLRSAHIVTYALSYLFCSLIPECTSRAHLSFRSPLTRGLRITSQRPPTLSISQRPYPRSYCTSRLSVGPLNFLSKCFRVDGSKSSFGGASAIAHAV